MPFCLQILAENAIKHDIGKMKKGAGVKVSAEKNNNDLMLKVMNMGSLNHKSDFLDKDMGIGLENLRKRLKINFRGKANFNISQQDNWITALVVLPLEG